ncbi:DUF1573 domain-containing protein [Alloprevotella tannerae]|uniref:DUF1573 domain-containing protein n=2 Tax=Alloprevotella tannerae TaxID=76122 RepID=UPI00391F0E9B
MQRKNRQLNENKVMKRFLLVAGLLLGAIWSTLQAQAVIQFEQTSHNFGTFSSDQPQKCEFIFTNIGDKPLVIQQAFSSCGCTVASFTRTPINPGEKGKVTISYNGKNLFPGHFKKPVTVSSNAKNNIVRVYIEGDMVANKK